MSDRLEVALTLHVPGFDLDVAWAAGDGVAVLFGPSGAGKTLTLSCLAGLITPATGRIVVDGRVFFDSAAGINLPPQRRRVGYVFQGYALFPHLTVADNLGFGLRDRPRAERTRRVARGGRAARPGRPRAAATRASSRAASASAWRWGARSPSSPRCCCSTSRCRRSTRRCAGRCATSCARS